MTWTTPSFFAKAQNYWTRASAKGRSDEDFLLSVSFALEFIIRGAICHVNPALNAASDFESIFFACGQTPRTPPKTIELSEALKRLNRMIPELTDDEILKVRSLVDARNTELHSDTAEIAQLSVDSLMPSIYSFIVKVTDFAQEDLSVLLGTEDASLAQQTAYALAKDRSKRVSDLIRICKERFFALPDGDQQNRRNEEKTDLISAVLTSGHHVKFLKCPACAAVGRLVATPVGRSSAFLRGEQLVQEVRVTPMQFSCKSCSLEIKGLDELMAAGFAHEYRSIDEVDPLEHFNIDPRDYVDEEEIAREYSRDQYEYNDE